MSKITAMYIRLSMEDEDVSLNQKEESNSVSSQRELLESFIGNHHTPDLRKFFHLQTPVPCQKMHLPALC